MHVLVVEDEIRLSDALCALLRAQKYMVDAVYNGQDGLAYAESGIYDLVILDVMLPLLDGFDVVAALRRRKVETPVLMLTARDSIPDKVKGLDCGADDYMTKPFAPDELLARVRVLTRRRGEVVLNTLSFDDITLSLTACELSCTATARTVRLNYKEVELLKLFLQSPDRIFSKEELITKVWGYDSDAGDNNVEAYISFLRKKLAFVGSRCQPIALKKIGYKLEVSACSTN